LGDGGGVIIQMNYNEQHQQHRNERGRCWVFTLNNYTDAEEKCIIDSVEKGTLVYFVYGREVGESGTPHLQGYCEFPKKVRFSTVKSLLPRAYIAKAKAKDSKTSINYCKKDGDWIEKGTCIKKGQRTDLETIRSLIVDGAPERDIADEFFGQWCRYRKSFSTYRGLVAGPRKWKSFVHVLWGKTGTGKTRIVHDLYGSENIWTYREKGWFDGYVGQPVALFDDFRGEEDGIAPGLFLRLLDRYPMHVGTKGSFTNWNPRKIYITSNVRPDDWFPSFTFDAFQAFKRRLDKIEYIDFDIFE